MRKGREGMRNSEDERKMKKVQDLKAKNIQANLDTEENRKSGREYSKLEQEACQSAAYDKAADTNTSCIQTERKKFIKCYKSTFM